MPARSIVYKDCPHTDACRYRPRFGAAIRCTCSCHKNSRKRLTRWTSSAKVEA